MKPVIEILYSECWVTRIAPDNFDEKDKSLFFPEDFRIKTREVHTARIRNGSISNLTLFHGCKIMYPYCRHTPLSNIAILKGYVKRFIYRREMIEKAFFAINEWGSNYFHWLTEVLPAVVVSLDRLTGFAVLLPENYRKYSFIKEALELFSIAPTYYPIRKIVFVRQLIVVNQPIVAQYNPSMLLHFKSEVEKRIVPLSKPTRKIYISRSKAQRRKVENETDLVNLLSGVGFESVCMEDLTFDGQVRLMQETSLLISCHGGGLTNMMFMPNRSTIYELKASNNDFNCFFALARLFEMKYYYQLCDFDDENHRISNIKVDLDRLRTNLDLLK